jgi:hypothetical protein
MPTDPLVNSRGRGRQRQATARGRPCSNAAVRRRAVPALRRSAECQSQFEQEATEKTAKGLASVASVSSCLKNGAYSAVTTGLRTNSQTGVWRWESARRQFSLTPSKNGSAFEYQLRVLRVDPRQPQTLQWIPLGGIGRMSGAVDYIRFKRKGE